MKPSKEHMQRNAKRLREALNDSAVRMGQVLKGTVAAFEATAEAFKGSRMSFIEMLKVIDLMKGQKGFCEMVLEVVKEDAGNTVWSFLDGLGFKVGEFKSLLVGRNAFGDFYLRTLVWVRSDHLDPFWVEFELHSLGGLNLEEGTLPDWDLPTNRELMLDAIIQQEAVQARQKELGRLELLGVIRDYLSLCQAAEESHHERLEEPLFAEG